MALEQIGSNEKTQLRHPPIVVPMLLLTLLFIVSANIVIFAAKSPDVSDNDMAIIVLISQALFFISVLLVIWLISNIARITNRRVIKLKTLPWKKNEEIALQDIEKIDRKGWFLFVIGGGRQIKFFCPPFFAPRIISTLREYVGPDFGK